MILQGDARALPLRDGCVDCVVTSPPYFGLRDYGTSKWSGGDPDCPHRGHPRPRNDTSGRRQKRFGSTRGHQPSKQAYRHVRNRCSCGAVRDDSQIGLEGSHGVYVDQIVAVFREVRRVLKDRGTVWLNLGDTYAHDAKWGGYSTGLHASPIVRAKRSTGLKGKNLVGIPWRVALALQADGWYLRTDIIWHKPNPLPESVSDRPTRSHEYLFLLTKSPRYHYDAAAIREPVSGTAHARGNGVNPKSLENHSGSRQNRSFSAAVGALVETRNRRSVWRVPTQPYKGSHFATMPERLIEPCILAGCPPGGLVVDPFFGSGTVGVVAERLGRQWCGLELSAAYCRLALERTTRAPSGRRPCMQPLPLFA